MNIYVGNLPYSTNEQSLKDLFAQFGEVATTKIIKDKITGKSKGFGFVEMKDNESGLQAISKLNGERLDGRPIKVSQARNPEKRDDFKDNRPTRSTRY